MRWKMSDRYDPITAKLADRHYNRQKVGSPQFVPPGRCLVLRSDDDKAFWVTSWPFAEYVRHAWAGAWVCSAFRSEGAGKASELIKQAVAATLAYYGEPPPLGMITFIDMKKVRPIKVRGALTWGRTWELAGFQLAGKTKGGLLAMQLLPERMPEPEPPIGMQLEWL